MRVIVRYYKKRDARIGPVLLEAYELYRSEEKSGEPADILTELAERYANTPDVVVEVVAMDVRGEERAAYAYTSGKGELLFQRPARLRRVYVIDELAVSSQSPQPLDKLPSYTPGSEIYVYIGRVAVENPKAKALLLETDKGTRVVMLETAGVKKDSNSSKAPA